MQFNEKYIYFVSKNRQIRYIFTIFSQTFYLFILFVFYIFMHKKSHLPKKTFSCFYLTDDFRFYMLLLFSIIEIVAIVFICDIIRIDPRRIKKNCFINLYFFRRRS